MLHLILVWKTIFGSVKNITCVNLQLFTTTKSAYTRKKIKDNNKIIFEVLMPDLTIWLHTYLRNKIKQCAFINSNHLHNILSVNIVHCSSSIFILTSIIKMLTFESLLLKHYNINMKQPRSWMLANLKIIWQFYAHPLHQKVSRFVGSRYIGTIFFRAESSLIQSNCRSLRNPKR